MFLEHDQALLFRVLSGFFGTERVIPFMSVTAVCGGTLPQAAHVHASKSLDVAEWAKRNKCLFTVVDAADNPRIVFEFFEGFDAYVDVNDVERQQLMRPLLEGSGVSYVTMSVDELGEMLDPSTSFDFYHWLKDKFESGCLLSPDANLAEE